MPGKRKREGKKTTRVRSRNYCFTDFKIIDLDAIYKANETVIRYLCWGKETCPKTKKIHQQGWIQMVNPKDFTVVFKLLGGKVHLEKMLGTEFQNSKYCKKEGVFEERGQFESMGFRSDLEDIKKRLDVGETMYGISQHHFGDCIRYHNGFGKYKEWRLKESTKNFRKIEVIVHAGKTGSGKTRKAVEENPDHFLIHGDDLKWFDGYTGEKVLIIDEYSNQVPITRMLSLLDGYQLRLAVKGGFTYANWTKIIITTNLDILHVNAKPEHIEALERRVTEIIDFK